MTINFMRCGLLYPNRRSSIRHFCACFSNCHRSIILLYFIYWNCDFFAIICVSHCLSICSRAYAFAPVFSRLHPNITFRFHVLWDAFSNLIRLRMFRSYDRRRCIGFLRLLSIYTGVGFLSVDRLRAFLNKSAVQPLFFSFATGKIRKRPYRWQFYVIQVYHSTQLLYSFRGFVLYRFAHFLHSSHTLKRFAPYHFAANPKILADL